MNMLIRPADLRSDQNLMIDTHFRYLTPLSNDTRFDWLYQNNPHGQARAWIALDERDGTVVGMASAFPRRVYIGEPEGERVGWVLGDFCINDRYRSLGPALQLQRACLTEVDSEAIAFCYDFPSTRMMAVYKRLGVNPLGQMLRLAKALRVDRKVSKVVKSALVANGLSTVGNVVLALRDYRIRDRGTLTIALHEGDCGEEFSTLARRIGGRYGVCTQRSAEYLNWRYLANPLSRYELLTVRVDGVLSAYTFFTHNGADVILEDLFGIDNRVIISSMIDEAVTLSRDRGVITVSIPLLESHPWLPLFQQLGFQVREASPIIGYTSPRHQSMRNMFGDMGWFLTYGDRDS